MNSKIRKMKMRCRRVLRLTSLLQRCRQRLLHFYFLDTDKLPLICICGRVLEWRGVYVLPVCVCSLCVCAVFSPIFCDSYFWRFAQPPTTVSGAPGPRPMPPPADASLALSTSLPSLLWDRAPATKLDRAAGSVVYPAVWPCAV